MTILYTIILPVIFLLIQLAVFLSIGSSVVKWFKLELNSTIENGCIIGTILAGLLIIAAAPANSLFNISAVDNIDYTGTFKMIFLTFCKLFIITSFGAGIFLWISYLIYNQIYNRNILKLGKDLPISATIITCCIIIAGLSIFCFVTFKSICDLFIPITYTLH